MKATRKVWVTVCVLVILLAVLGTLPATADDGCNYPGCQHFMPTRTPAPSPLSTPVFQQYGKYNHIYLPIVTFNGE